MFDESWLTAPQAQLHSVKAVTVVNSALLAEEF
jgi:hypothetical protein